MNKIKKRLKNTTLYYKYLIFVRKKFKKKRSKESLQTVKENISKMYSEKIGKRLNWDNPVNYTEKMQWSKLYNRSKYKTELTDKYLVRRWVANKIGESFLIPLLGVWDNPNEIDFTQLPNQFVLKTNCGSNDVIIIKNKEKLNKHDYKMIKKKLEYFLTYDFYLDTYEMHYSEIEPKIIAEKLLVDKTSSVPDYKFTCFNGKPEYCWVDLNRQTNHTRHVYDMDWNFQHWNQVYEIIDLGLPRPANFDKMVEIAKILSEDFSHVRVDLYNIDGVIYFGELTFTNGSGFDVLHPEKTDKMLGDLWTKYDQ